MGAGLYPALQSWQERPTGRVKHGGGVCSSRDIGPGLSPGWLVSSEAASVGTAPVSAFLAAAEQRPASAQRPLRGFPSSVLPVMQHPRGSGGEDACGCPLPPSGRTGGGKGEENHSAPCVPLSASSWQGAAASLPIRSLQKRWAHLIWLGLSPSDGVCN